jgi:polyisoprenoid-binding protein YceI
MKKNTLIAGIAALVMLASCGGNAVKTEDAQAAGQSADSARVFALDSSASNVEWLAKKVTGQHNGTLAIKSGELKTEGGKLTSGRFTINMASIKVVDITDAKANADLAGHLNSEDFFSTQKFPEGTFELISAEPIANAAAGSANYTVKGNLTLKGISKAISFPATIAMNAESVTATADFEIDRTEWDIRYGSGKFFKDIGDKAINDNFNVKLNLVAKAS